MSPAASPEDVDTTFGVMYEITAWGRERRGRFRRTMIAVVNVSLLPPLCLSEVFVM